MDFNQAVRNEVWKRGYEISNEEGYKRLMDRIDGLVSMGLTHSQALKIIKKRMMDSKDI